MESSLKTWDLTSFCSQLVELKNGETFNGHLQACDAFMNLTLREVYQTSAVSNVCARESCKTWPCWCATEKAASVERKLGRMQRHL